VGKQVVIYCTKYVKWEWKSLVPATGTQHHACLLAHWVVIFDLGSACSMHEVHTCEDFFCNAARDLRTQWQTNSDFVWWWCTQAIVRLA